MQDTEPELFKIVTRHMLHGPCGVYKRDAPCMKNGVCEKHFPRPYCKVTTEVEDAYVELARPDDGVVVMKATVNGAVPFTNANVVAHFPLLSRLLDSHINGEAVKNLTNPKYLYKSVITVLVFWLSRCCCRYPYKGTDSALIAVVPIDGKKVLKDEIKVLNRHCVYCDALWLCRSTMTVVISQRKKLTCASLA